MLTYCDIFLGVILLCTFIRLCLYCVYSLENTDKVVKGFSIFFDIVVMVLCVYCMYSNEVFEKLFS